MDYQKVLKYLPFTKGVYGTGNNTSALNIGTFTTVDILGANKAEVGFMGALYKDASGKYVMSLAGTNDLKINGDLGADGILAIQEYVGAWHPEFQAALNFAKNVIIFISGELEDKLGRTPTINEIREKLEVTGHSLGGAMAELVAKVYGLGGLNLDGPGAVTLATLPEVSAYRREIQTIIPDLADNYELGGTIEFSAEAYSVVGMAAPHHSGMKFDYLPSAFLAFNAAIDLAAYSIGGINLPSLLLGLTTVGTDAGLYHPSGSILTLVERQISLVDTSQLPTISFGIFSNAKNLEFYRENSASPTAYATALEWYAQVLASNVADGLSPHGAMINGGGQVINGVMVYATREQGANRIVERTLPVDPLTGLPIGTNPTISEFVVTAEGQVGIVDGDSIKFITRVTSSIGQGHIETAGVGITTLKSDGATFDAVFSNVGSGHVSFNADSAKYFSGGEDILSFKADIADRINFSGDFYSSIPNANVTVTIDENDVEVKTYTFEKNNKVEVYTIKRNLETGEVEFSSGSQTETKFSATYSKVNQNEFVRLRTNIENIEFSAKLVSDGKGGLKFLSVDEIDGDPVADQNLLVEALNASKFNPFFTNDDTSIFNMFVFSGQNTLDKLKKIREDNSSGNWWNDPDVQKIGNSLSSIQNLIAALKSGNSLGVATASANLATIWSDGATSGVSDALNAWGDVVSLKAALKRGDHTSVLKSGLSLSNSVLKVYRALLEDEVKQIASTAGQAAAKASQASTDLANVTSAMDNINTIISVINIISDLKEENYLEVIASIAALMGYPVIGWVLSVGKILAALIEPDKIYYAKLTLGRASDGTFSYNFNSATDKEAKASTEAMMKGLLTPLQEMLTHLPDARMIVDRMPVLELDRKKSDTWFLTYEDASTGQTMRSYFDAKGRLLSTGTLAQQIQAIDSDDFFKDIGQLFIDATFKAGAIAPVWEADSIAEKNRVRQGIVESARERWEARRTNGNRFVAPENNTTLNSVGWAKHDGHLILGAVTGPTQVLRPIVLDLNGDGIKLLSRDDGYGVLFDVDNDGYAEETDWIDAHDGILVSDYDANGVIDTGTELFNNINIDALKRGLLGLKEFDNNWDMYISADEAQFSKLRVWRDLNLDGIASPHELKTMSELGISMLNLRNGTFIRNGVTHQLGQVALTADSQGVLTDMFDNVLVVTNEDGSVETFAAAVEDQTKLSSAGIHFAKSSDEKMMAGYDRINAVEDTAIIVNAAQLLLNDGIVAVGLDHASLKITALKDPVNGSVSYEPETGKIIFTPTANFTGDGYFSYTLSDGSDRTAEGIVRVKVLAVNDLPVIENQILSNIVREVTGKVSAHDVESGTELTYTIAHQGLYGNVTIDATTGAWTYTRNADEMSVTGGFKPDAFAVKVTDKDGGSSLLKILPYNVSPQSTTQVKAVSSPTTQEGSALDFNVVLSEPTKDVTEVTLTPEDKSAQFNVDTGAGAVSFDGGVSYAPFSGNKVQVPQGIVTFTVRYLTVTDAIAESSENLVLRVATQLNTTPVLGTGTIAEKSVFSIQGATSVAESAGSVEYIVSLSQASSKPSSVRIHSVSNSAGNADYIGLVSQVITFLPGETSKKVVVGINQDRLVEGSESFGLILSEPIGEALIGTPDLQVLIVDDDGGNPGGEPGPDSGSGSGRHGNGPTGAGQAGLSGAVQPRRDPLALDLDGDGIETNNTGGNGQPILFDHDADGVKTGTGWLRPDDAWLALDINGNGKIDNGRELFGVDTLLKSGTFAQNGFAALADNDVNLDGKIDQLDPIFANLKVWRDLNQDGISQVNELSSLAQNKIASISLGARQEFINLGNGNVQTAAGSFTREDGSVQAAVELSSTIVNLDLLQNTFFSEFVDALPLDEDILALPNLSGSGRVRDLSEAIALSGQLGLLVYDYSVKTNRVDQIAMLDDFVSLWASTSTFKSLQEQATALAGAGVSVNYALPIAAGTPEYLSFLKKIQIVEKFMGFTYGTSTGGVRTTALDASAGVFTVSLARDQVANIQLAYDRFKSYIYESLLFKTIYRDFLSIEIKKLPNGDYDVSGIEKYFDSSFASDPNAAIKLIEIIGAWGLKNAQLVGWDVQAYLHKKYSVASNHEAFEMETKDWYAKLFGVTETDYRAISENNFIVGNSKNNSIQLSGGENSAFGAGGDDTLFGSVGGDILDGGDGIDLLLGYGGNDTLYGGAGNDRLVGGDGSDVYIFSRGDGLDSIDNEDADMVGVNPDMISFGANILLSDISFSRTYDDLVMKIKGTADQLIVNRYFAQNVTSSAAVEIIKFSDGTLLGIADIKNLLLQPTDDSDRLVGYDSDDIIFGGAGNDYLFGGNGSDVLTGGSGADILAGESGNDRLFGDDGNDTLSGGDGNDNLEGGDGNDSLYGQDGDDFLKGGLGDDFIDGGVGHDIYSYDLNSGNDTFTSRPDSLLQFGEGILASNVTVRNDGYSNLILSFNGSANILTIGNYFLANPNEWAFSAIKFATGEVWRYTDIKAKSLVDARTQGDDLIFGTSDNEIISGDAGNDRIYGRAGNDTIDGGIGDDFLDGGTGSDVYKFGRHSGNDIVWDITSWQDNTLPAQNIDTILLDAGITLSDIKLSVEGQQDLLVHILGTAATLRIKNYYFGGEVSSDTVERIQFANGTVWGMSEINAQLNKATELSDILYGTAVNDTVDGLGGSDQIYGKDGNDTLFGGVGSDFLYGENGDDTLSGGADADYLSGGDGGDTLNGDDGDDSLYGDAGNDVLNGGNGNDYLYGENGSDSYKFGRDSGYDTLFERGESGADVDVILFDAGIAPTDITASRLGNTDLVLRINGSESKLEIRDYFQPNYVDASYVRAIEKIQFSDGTIWDYETVKALMLKGTPGYDNIIGFSTDDLLNGGLGNDSLAGGAGSDTYKFDLNFGDDVIFEEPSADANRIIFGAGILPGDILVGRDFNANDLWMAYKDTSNIIHVKNYFSNELNAEVISTIKFADNTIWSFNDIKAKVLIGNSNNPNAYVTGFATDDTLSGGSETNYFNGMGGSDTYLFGRNSGDDNIIESEDLLPSVDVLLLDAGITPNDIFVKGSGVNLELRIKGESSVLRVANFFNESFIQNGFNSSSLEKIQFADGTVWNINEVKRRAVLGTDEADMIIGLSGNDVIVGGKGDDYLAGKSGDDIYLFNRGDGMDAIENRDSVNAIDTLRFGVNILESDVVAYKTMSGATGNLNFRIRGSDDQIIILTYYSPDETINGELTNAKIDLVEFSDGVKWDASKIQLAVENSLTNHAPTIGTVLPATVSAAANTLFKFVVPVNAMVDTDPSDSIRYSFDDPQNGVYLPEGWFFDRVTRTLSAQLPKDASGSMALTLIAKDDYGVATTQSFTLNVTPYVNHAPTLVTAIPDQNVRPNVSLNFVIPSNTFADVDFGDVLTYKATLSNGSALPSWLKFDAVNKVFTGSSGVLGTTSVKVTAKDQSNATVSDVFDIVIGVPNQTLVGTADADTLIGDLGNDILTGLTGNDALSGAGGNDVYIFNRGDGQDTIDNLDLLTATDTLRFATGIIDTDVLAFKSGNHLAFKLKNSTDQVVISNYYAANTTINGQAADYKIDKVEFSNAVSWSQTMIQTMVDRATNNKAPTLGTAVSNQISKVNMAYSFTVPANTIVDTDVGDSVTYSLKMQDGSALPSWLSFNATTRVISGTPAVSNLGTLSLTLWGTDNYGLALGQNLTMTVNPANRAPVLAVALPDQTATQSTAFTYTIPSSSFTDPDAGDTLSYSATLADGSVLPVWLSFNATTRVFSGTPTSAGTISVKVTAKDAGNLSVSDVFDVVINVANLTLTGTSGADTLVGGAGNDTLSGLAGNDKLTGNAGNDVLDGGAGTDTLIGGLGDDTYVVDVATDVVTENLNEGIDTVKSGVTLTLPANVENLILTGTTAINGTGNALSNTITGNSAINTLDGGAGADTLIGGAGNDIYVIDNIGDLITENSGEGTDQVNSSVSYTLAANVENLTLTGTTSINGTGNALANILTGNAGNNILDGGAGADTMTGGAGDDIYIVDNTADVVTEAVSAGTDLVQSSISYILGTNIENLTLTGSAAINATGNTVANILVGNSGNNILDGGTGADTMSGGAGNDIYLIDNASDVATENTGEGNDQVKSSVTYTLIANLEALLLTGTTAINGTGNALDNLLTGNAANNILNGASGNDILQGVAGDDTLTDTAGNNIFDGGAGIDVITAGVGNDFIVGGVGNDTITTSTGADVIAFNRGDGMDVVNASTGKDNTLSLGKGIKYADLLFKKSGNDLILVTGTSEQVTMKDWYANVNNHSIANLQVVIEGTTDYNAASTNKLNNKKIEQFNFDGLVTKFDQARAANSSLTSWALSASLLEFYLNSSDTAAMGGDLAYQYAKMGNLSGFTMAPALNLVSNAQFGTVNQTLQPVANLKDATVSLV
ncbi:calcium-binding protein [Undibacterium flavidum]|uniref:Ig domain-containing protein n=1 Tax=Undibacterium flavidum TaxID=2762297 RepID=A0ABR6YAU3_9BURK|nr:calcium-binding protein [Undibacterium flavidum]MBC3873681.1 putative Ig domain-containing protein [Undibacterium flavidum]